MNSHEHVALSVRKNGTVWLPWVIGVGLTIRILWSVLVPVVPISDAVVYDLMARHIALGHGPSLQPLDTPTEQIGHSAYWPIGAPAILGFFYYVFGMTYWPIVVVNIGANVATIWLVVKLGEMWLSRTHGLTAGLFLSLWPSQIAFCTVPASEHLFGLFILVAIYFWECESRNAWKSIPLSGLSLAVACLIRPTALLIPVLLFWMSWSKSPWRQLCVRTILCGLCMIGAILPWSLYNASQFGSFVLVSTNGGCNFWMGNHPGTSGGYTNLPDEVQGMSEVTRDKFLKDKAMQYIRSEPVEFVKRTIIKLIRLHERESIGIVWNDAGLLSRFGTPALNFSLKLLSNIYWWVMLLLGISGVLIYASANGMLKAIVFPPVVFWSYFAAVHAVIVIQDRYHFPSIPFIAILASVPVIWWLNRRLICQRDTSETDVLNLLPREK